MSPTGSAKLEIAFPSKVYNCRVSFSIPRVHFARVMVRHTAYSTPWITMNRKKNLIQRKEQYNVSTNTYSDSQKPNIKKLHLIHKSQKTLSIS